MKRFFKIATVLSAVLCFVSIILLLLSLCLYLPGPPDDGATIALGADYHCGLGHGCLWFFDDEMPYTGSIIGLQDVVIGFDFPGIYFRHLGFSNSPQDNWTTLVVVLFYPIALFAILPSWWLVGKLRAYMRSRAVESAPSTHA